MEMSDEEFKWHKKGYKKGQADSEMIKDELFKQVKRKDAEIRWLKAELKRERAISDVLLKKNRSA